MRGTMRMFSGQLVDVLRLRPDQVRLDDICYSLGNICRYGGHCHVHYSVAEHSCDVIDRVRIAGGSTADQLFAGLHDAGEAYCGDIPSPIKDRLGIPAIEDQIQKAVANAFGLEWDTFKQSIEEGLVKRCDIEAGQDERAWLWTADATLTDPNPRHWGQKLHSVVSHLLIEQGMRSERLATLGVFR